MCVMMPTAVDLTASCLCIVRCLSSAAMRPPHVSTPSSVLSCIWARVMACMVSVGQCGLWRCPPAVCLAPLSVCCAALPTRRCLHGHRAGCLYCVCMLSTGLAICQCRYLRTVCLLFLILFPLSPQRNSTSMPSSLYITM
jgi:hypothetical protein